MPSTMITAGIDIGSITAKAAVLADGRLLGTKVGLTGYNAEAAGLKVYEELLVELNLSAADVARIVSTGYGRTSFKFADKTITEITCHAAGARFQNPKVRSLIDVGGQDSKALVMDEAGRVRDFVMNDKCAAGTGRFLEVMAKALEVDLDQLGPLSLQAESPSRISSICTVFAESEVISLIAKGEGRENIIAGIHEAIAVRVSSLIKRLDPAAPLIMTGGVARNVGVVKALESKLELPIQVLNTAQVNGAIGAAVLAAGL
ncbi:MAG: acyl-CoA dehydratase activase [Thermodesulfobacteriota bacterium]